MPLDLSRCRLPPFQHQVLGVEKIVEHPYFFLADTMGIGKTKQVIDAAQVMFTQGTIDRVIVIAPAGVRAVWFDPELGELRKHLWENLEATIVEFHAKIRRWQTVEGKEGLSFIISNYELIGRSKNRLKQLMGFTTKKTLLVLDESIGVKNHQSLQAKACLELRRACGRVTLLNGTPIANHPGDLFSQMNIMDPRILNCPSYTQFCKRYAVMQPVLGHGGKPILSPRGFPVQTVAGWRNIDHLQRLIAPYVIRRLKDACPDLPPKIPPVALSVPLNDVEWKLYKAMRDELCAWLSSQTVSMAPQAITKVMRLAQITSGFLGGVQSMDLGTSSFEWEHVTDEPPDEPVAEVKTDAVQEVGRSKLDYFFSWLDDRLAEDLSFKCIVWSRFTPELRRAIAEAKLRYPHIPVGVVAGGYKKADREFALRLLDPRTAPEGPALVFGNPQSGGLGLNMTAASCMFRLSSDYSHFKRDQSEDRIHRPGQVRPTSYFDLIATGPQGQKTIDFVVLAALMRKDDLDTMTCSAWVKALTGEE